MFSKYLLSGIFARRKSAHMPAQLSWAKKERIYIAADSLIGTEKITYHELNMRTLTQGVFTTSVENFSAKELGFSFLTNMRNKYSYVRGEQIWLQLITATANSPGGPWAARI